MIALAVVLTGGPHSPAMAWFAIPIVTLSARFPTRGVILGLAVTVVMMIAVAFGSDAHAVLAKPPLLIMPLALAIAVAILSTALMHSDVIHRSEAVIDPLTGMLNRNSLKDRTFELAHQSRRTGQPVGLIVGDLDHFKQVNDSYGHATGDAVLQDVAYLLRKQLRAFDLAYRIGGEEFLVLLPGANREQAEAMAERLRHGVQADTVGGGLRVTMSFGVSASPARRAFDYQQVCEEADAALYEAKRQGRNRVCGSGAAVVQPRPQRSEPRRLSRAPRSAHALAWRHARRGSRKRARQAPDADRLHPRLGHRAARRHRRERRAADDPARARRRAGGAAVGRRTATC